SGAVTLRKKMLILRKTFLTIRRAVPDNYGHQQDAWAHGPGGRCREAARPGPGPGGIAKGRLAQALGAGLPDQGKYTALLGCTRLN
ncbi:MAG: hypothetical protein ACREXU_08330, partial [Gammaproteobacteria bacterium]